MIKPSTLHVGLCGPLPPPFGGMANQLNQFHILLTQTNVPVTLVQTNAPYAFPLIDHIKGLRAIFRLIPYFYKLWKLTGTVDVIHVFANSGWSWQLFAAPVLWMGGARKTPVIINYRGGEADSYFTKSIRWVRPSMNKAKVIVVPSEFLKEVFAKYGFETKVVPNIINLERFNARHRPSFDKHNPHIVITRNLEAIYGLVTAIKAIAIVRQTVPNLKLSIAGSGPQLTELEQLVRTEQLEDSVFFTGKLTPEQVAELYQKADIMLNPTTVDNMPNSILEAMACGIAIVTTNVGGIPYIVEHDKTALYAEVNNPHSLADQLLRLINERGLYERLVNHGLQEVQQYTWQNIKPLWMAIYAESQVNS